MQFDPQPVLSQLIPPGPPESIPVRDQLLLHLQGQFAQTLSEGANSVLLVAGYQLEGTIQEILVPLGLTVELTGAPGSLTASYNLAGTITEAVYPQGSTTPSWLIKAQISLAGNLSGALYPPEPVFPDSLRLGQKLVAHYIQDTTLSQTETPAAGGQSWLVQATLHTVGDFSEIFAPPDPCRESFSVQDLIHLDVAPVLSVAPGPVMVIDAVVKGAGTRVDVVVVPLLNNNNLPLALMGSYQLSGQLQETIQPPPSSNPSSAAGTESLSFELAADGLFDQVSVNPQPLPPG